MMHITDQSIVISLWPESAPGSEEFPNPEQETLLPMPTDIPQTLPSPRMHLRCSCWPPAMTRWPWAQVCLSIPRGEMPVGRSNCTSTLEVVMASR